MWATIHITQWFWLGVPAAPSPQFTADQIIQFMKSIDVPNKTSIKIVAIPEWATLANAVEDAFKLTGYKLELNKDDSDYIFRSTKPHGKVIIRSNPPTMVAFSISTAFLSFNLFPEFLDFAPEDQREYVQIEIGGSL
jgi:hypothetical protein